MTETRTPGRPRPVLGAPPVTRLVLAAGAVSAAIFAWWVARDPHGMMQLFDLHAYQVAGQRVVAGTSLYDTPLVGTVRGVFEFVYAPFAALLFAPLAGLYGAGMLVAGLLLGIGLLLAVVAVSLAGLRTPGRLSPLLVLGLAGLALWCEPVWETVTFGQVNLLLALLVLADLLGPPSARGRGVLVGIAAGIKLTPLFFVAYLLLTRRFREAAVATGTFLATVLAGALVLPRDSVTFWSGAFADPSRVGVPGHPGNQSLRGMIARELGDGPGDRGLWLGCAVLVAVAGLALAARLAARGQRLGAVAVCGMTSTAVSPFSWVHHWVWFVPLLVLLLERALRHGSVRGWLGFGVATAVGCHWFFRSLGDATAGLGGVAGALVRAGYQNGYVVLTVALLVAVARLPEHARRTPRGRSRGRFRLVGWPRPVPSPEPSRWPPRSM
ncbi:MAG TPA: glycosyltransferase 87 family protein [Pseudonocardia sp.]|jgi:alpha-1,2-mannosyltransferase